MYKKTHSPLIHFLINTRKPIIHSKKTHFPSIRKPIIKLLCSNFNCAALCIINLENLELPEEIIQHIQSYLDGKEAAQTTLLSRSWFQAWLTRPNLDFDQKHFANNDFWKSIKTIVERYEKLNIKINTFRLWINEEHSPVNELIIKVLKAGATTCLDFKSDDKFAFPHQVFGFENLTRLSVSCFKFEDQERPIVRYSRLKYLTLELAFIKDDNIISDIISSCPLLEDFSLSITLDDRALPQFFGKQHPFHKLKSLFLKGVRLHPSFFDHFSCKFPRLKDLNIDNYRGYTDIVQISSPSLECIKFGSDRYIIRTVKLDVPKIREFSISISISSPNIPLLSFETTSTSNWSSHIHIDCESAPSDKWFLDLSKLLKKFNKSSELNLYLYMWSEKPSESAGKLRGLINKPEVDYVTITGSYAAFPDFYYSLFKCCRPSYIELSWFPKYIKEQDDVDDVTKFLWLRKMQQVCFDSCIAYQMMCGCDLRKVKVGFHDEWRTRFVDATSTTSIRDAADDDEQKILFRFKWSL